MLPYVLEPASLLQNEAIRRIVLTLMTYDLISAREVFSAREDAAKALSGLGWKNELVAEFSETAQNDARKIELIRLPSIASGGNH